MGGSSQQCRGCGDFFFGYGNLCKDCGLIDKKFTTSEVDIIFSKVVPKGRRRMGLKEFIAALEQVARKKAVDVEDVHDAIANCGGPLFQGTEVGSFRFHDDKWKYTGTHKNGGPDAG